MIPTELQTSLKKRIENLFEHERYLSPKGGSVPLSFFEQRLPKKTKAEDEFFPLIIIKLFDGEKKNKEDSNKVNIGLVIGIYDNGSDNQGYRDVTHIMNKVIKNLYENPMVNDQFELLSHRWALVEEETEPYLFGAVEMTFEAPEPIRQPRKEMRDML